MSMLYAERLIEYAIRIGVDDIMKDDQLLNLLFFTDKHLKVGADLTPPGQEPGSVREPLPFDYFQKRLLEIPKRQAETGQQEIFKNSIPEIPDIRDYLSNANIRIMHGYPRDEKDLPAITITLGNEDEEQFLGNIKQVVQGESKRYAMVGSNWDSQYLIQILSPNYDETVVWYHLIRYALLRYRAHIEGYGMGRQSMSWMDMELAPQFAQAGLYVYQRSCVLRCVKDEDVPIEVNEFNEFSFGINTPSGPPAGQGDGTIVPNPDGPPPEPIHPLEYTEP